MLDGLLFAPLLATSVLQPVQGGVGIRRNVLRGLGAHDLTLELEDLLGLVGVADRTLVETGFNPLVGGALADPRRKNTLEVSTERCVPRAMASAS